MSCSSIFFFCHISSPSHLTGADLNCTDVSVCVCVCVVHLGGSLSLSKSTRTLSSGKCANSSPAGLPARSKKSSHRSCSTSNISASE